MITSGFTKRNGARRPAPWRHLAAGLLLALGACSGAEDKALPDIVIADTEVYPESVTSAADGTVFIGSIKGNVYKAEPGEAEARPWIRTSPENGILAILGVLADEKLGTLWLCSIPNLWGEERSQGVSSLMAFDLETGDQKGVYPFPPPASVCNDIAVGPEGTVYATVTSNGRIFRINEVAGALDLFGQDESLKGVDGIAFAADGTLYVNNVTTGDLIRVEVGADGRMGALTTLEVSHLLGGPDGFRPIGGNRFLLAEGGAGRLSIVHIEGGRARLEILKDDLESSPGATPVGDTSYVLESKIGYLMNEELRGQDPGEFVVYAVPMNGD